MPHKRKFDCWARKPWKDWDEASGALLEIIEQLDDPELRTDIIALQLAGLLFRMKLTGDKKGKR